MLWPIVVPVLFPLTAMKFCFKIWSSWTTQLFSAFWVETFNKIIWQIIRWFSCRIRLSVRNLDLSADLNSTNFSCLWLFSNSVCAEVCALYVGYWY